MFAVGLLIHTQPSFSQTALSSLLAKLESTADAAGVTLDTSQFSVADVAYSFTIAIIAFGFFLAAISVLGLIGVKYGLKPVLIVVSWSFSVCVCLSVSVSLCLCLCLSLSPPPPLCSLSTPATNTHPFYSLWDGYFLVKGVQRSIVSTL